MNARFGAFEVDSDRRQLLREGSEVHVTPKAFDLLAFLVAEAPRVVHKAALHERLWPGTFVSDATLAGLIKEVRRALDDRDATSPLIRTAHGVGYAFAGTLDRAPISQPGISRWIVAGTRRIPLSEGDHVIGRDPLATVALEVPGVSRRHARIRVDSGGASLEDLGSKNGTRVRSTPVTGPIVLHDGDQIHIGPVLIIFHVSASGVSTDTIA